MPRSLFWRPNIELSSPKDSKRQCKYYCCVLADYFIRMKLERHHCGYLTTENCCRSFFSLNFHTFYCVFEVFKFPSGDKKLIRQEINGSPLTKNFKVQFIDYFDYNWSNVGVGGTVTYLGHSSFNYSPVASLD